MEEAGVDVPVDRLHLTGLISETAYENRTHWLIFYYRVLGATWTEPRMTREGELAWYSYEELLKQPIPESDREVIWPLVREMSRRGAPLEIMSPDPPTALAGGEGPALGWTELPALQATRATGVRSAWRAVTEALELRRTARYAGVIGVDPLGACASLPLWLVPLGFFFTAELPSVATLAGAAMGAAAVAVVNMASARKHYSAASAASSVG